MNITEEEIRDCLDEVDEEMLVALLDQSEELSYLSRAIVKEVINETSQRDTNCFLRDCLSYVSVAQWELAKELAREKKNRSSFSCEMKDEFN